MPVVVPSGEARRLVNDWYVVNSVGRTTVEELERAHFTTASAGSTRTVITSVSWYWLCRTDEA